MLIGYGTRVVVSLAYPLGLGLDIVTGMFSVGLAEALWGRSHGFAATLTTTLIHGTLMNVILMIYMLNLFGVLRFFMPKPVPEGYCKQCRYDLRGSRHSARCPECGTPTPWADEVAGGAGRVSPLRSDEPPRSGDGPALV